MMLKTVIYIAPRQVQQTQPKPSSVVKPQPKPTAARPTQSGSSGDIVKIEELTTQVKLNVIKLQ